MPCSTAVSTPATLDLPGIRVRYGLSRTAIYRAIRERGFPRPMKLGSRSYWFAAEIDAWLAERAAERDQAPADTDLREARRRAGLASAAARRARRDAAAAAAPVTDPTA